MCTFDATHVCLCLSLHLGPLLWALDLRAGLSELEYGDQILLQSNRTFLQVLWLSPAEAVISISKSQNVGLELL